MLIPKITLPPFGLFIAGQGGYLSAIMRGHVVNGVEKPPYALLVSDAAAGEGMAAWGCYGDEIEGASSRNNGAANTAAMLAAGSPAAQQVKALCIDGHEDWFVASLGEMNAAAANVPELFSTDNVYATSTQGSRDSAFVQDFEDGGSYWDFKDYERRVRAFRAISLELLAT